MPGLRRFDLVSVLRSQIDPSLDCPVGSGKEEEGEQGGRNGSPDHYRGKRLLNFGTGPGCKERAICAYSLTSPGNSGGLSRFAIVLVFLFGRDRKCPRFAEFCQPRCSHFTSE